MPLMLLLLALALVPDPCQAAPVTLQVKPGFAKNLALFHSEATIESFEGSTRQVSGQVKVDPAAPGTGSTAWFQVDLTTLDTGISMRNTHMRENHLHTAKYPTTRFELKSLSGPAPALKAGAPVRLTATGDFTLHGVTKARTVPVDVTWYPDGAKTPAKKAGPALHLVCHFDVGLADHQIPRPEFLFMKMAEQMQVTVDLWAVTP
jgi:polyisoprenoid-binding protein YceI